MQHTLIDRFVDWCYHSKDYAFIRDSRFGVPALQSVHLMGLTLLLGTVLVMNLRLLRVGFRQLSLSALAEQLLPWTTRGLAVTILSGILVFLPDPTRYGNSGPFRLKVALLCVSVIYHFAVFRPTVRMEPESRMRGITVSAISLVLWFSTGWAGRAIAFFQ